MYTNIVTVRCPGHANVINVAHDVKMLHLFNIVAANAHTFLVPLYPFIISVYKPLFGKYVSPW